MITQEELKEYLHYELETGLFTWIKRLNNKSQNIAIGVPLTKPNKNGYLSITFKDRLYKTHRLAWLYVYGYLPTKEIDHVNGIRSDNRICNLREATRSQNGMNRGMQSNNSSGYKGVSFVKCCNKWRARTIINQKVIYLGLYKTAKEAYQAYLTYAKNNHGEFFHV